MREEDIRDLFNYYLNQKPKSDSTRFPGRFIRDCVVIDESKTEKSNSFLRTNNDEYVKKSDEIIRKKLILEYIKMFYGKNFKSFCTKEFSLMCKKFNDLISKNKFVDDKVKQIIKTGIVDEEDFLEGGILEDLVKINGRRLQGKKERKKRSEYNGISIDNDDYNDIILNLPRHNVARIYLNPSKQYYSDIYNYIMLNCLKEEIPIGYKSRYSLDTADNLILYIPKNCLGRVLKILNNYERHNPEKVASFLNPPFFLERNSHNWYGFGHELSGIRNSSGVAVTGTTLNEDVETMFVRYIFPLLFLDNYGKIVDLSGKSNIRDRICSMLGDKEFNFKMSIGSSRKKIIQEMLDFKEKIKQQISDEKYENEDLAYIYKNFNLNWNNLLRDIEIRNAFNEFFKKSENFEQAIKDIMYLINHYCEQIEYLGGGSIYTSKYLIKEKENNREIVLNFINLMRSKQYDYTDDNRVVFEQELNNYLNSVGGLDNVILAFDYCEGIESLSQEEIVYARRQINKLRKKRGKNILQNKTPLSELSRFEVEDVSFDNIDELIWQQSLDKRYGVHPDDVKQYDVYKAFIDGHSDILDDELVSKLEGSINKYIQTNFYKRKLLEYLYTKINEDKKIR